MTSIVETAQLSTQADELCEVCAHPSAAHDRIASRFCSATIAGALTRGCLCPRQDAADHKG